MILIALLIPALLGRRRSSSAAPARQHGAGRVSDYVSMPNREARADALVSRVFTGTERVARAHAVVAALQGRAPVRGRPDPAGAGRQSERWS